MVLTWPTALLTLLIVPYFALLYIWVLRRRQRYILSYSSLEIVRPAAGAGQRVRRHLPAALFLMALSAMSIGLSRPNATFIDPEATGTVILVVDTSRSMLATDIAPSRIDAARAAIRDFSKKQPSGIRIGVVAFSGGAQLLTPPTTDRELVNAAVNFVTLGRGTNVGEGLQVALQTIVSPEPPDPFNADEAVRTPLVAPDRPEESIIVLLSDGASTVGPDPLGVAHDLGEMGVRVYTVGLGTATGGTNPGFGNSRRFEEDTLKEIAAETGGRYYTARNASQLGEVYGHIATSHELVEKRTELTFLAVAAAVLFSITGAVLGSIWGARLP